MRRARHRSGFEEPSLVPLADMLSNTVGVMVFIFIFTVITAGGATVMKRLPLERPADLQSVVVACTSDRAQGFDQEALVREFMESLEKKNFQSLDDLLEELRDYKLDQDGVEVSGELAFGGLAFTMTPRPESGESVDALKQPGSRLRTFLGRFSPRERSIFFLVHPDGLQAFKAARAVAAEKGFKTGWRPLKAGQPLQFSPGGRNYSND